MTDLSQNAEYMPDHQKDGEKEVLFFPLTIDGQEMVVRYVPNYSTIFPVGHFEFHSPHQPSRRIPVSATGYRSHFAPMPHIEAAPSPQAYAHALALAIIHENSTRTQEEDSEQLSLFS